MDRVEATNELLRLKQQDLDLCKLQAASYDVHLEEAYARIEQLKKSLERLENSSTKKEWCIEMPQVDVEELKRALKLADVHTMELLLRYIKLDSYSLVKNIARTVNWNTFAESAIYLDGAMSRNEALIDVLTSCSRNATMINRVTGKEEAVKKPARQ